MYIFLACIRPGKASSELPVADRIARYVVERKYALSSETVLKNQNDIPNR